MGFKDTIKQLFFPDGIKCIFCDGEISKENRYCVCDNCSPEFNVKFCLRCGKAIKNAAEYCHDCKEGTTYFFDEARAPFVYGGVVSDAVYRLKYGSGRYAAKFMAEYMADTYYEADWNIDLISFVPMSKKRQAERGYNQAQLLAEALSTIIKLPCVELLTRKPIVGNLAKMNRQQRAEAIRGTVDIIPGVDLNGKNVLLIDDVMTTSATMNECAKAIKRAKAASVCALTFATSRVKPYLY